MNSKFTNSAKPNQSGEKPFLHILLDRNNSKYCEFHDEKREIKAQIIQNGISSKLRRKGLPCPKFKQTASKMLIESPRKPAADKNVQPVVEPPRKNLFDVPKKLEEQLLNDEKLGVIEKTEGPPPWVSPVVVVPKKEGKVRVCMNMRQVNKSIKRERHITPTINEIINDLNGAKVFSELDLNQGYNQLELAQESNYESMII